MVSDEVFIIHVVISLEILMSCNQPHLGEIHGPYSMQWSPSSNPTEKMSYRCIWIRRIAVWNSVTVCCTMRYYDILFLYNGDRNWDYYQSPIGTASRTRAWRALLVHRKSGDSGECTEMCITTSAASHAAWPASSEELRRAPVCGQQVHPECLFRLAWMFNPAACLHVLWVKWVCWWHANAVAASEHNNSAKGKGWAHTSTIFYCIQIQMMHCREHLSLSLSFN